MRQGGERSRQVPKRQRSTAWKSELAEINAKARQEGMSYGKYVGLMYCEERDTLKIRAYPFDAAGNIVCKVTESTAPAGLTEEKFFAKPILTEADLTAAVGE